MSLHVNLCILPKGTDRFPVGALIPPHFQNAKNGRKKAANLFSIYCSWLPLWDGGYSVFMLSVKDGLDSFRAALMYLYNGIIRKKSITHGTTPPFPLSAASRQAGHAARLYCTSTHFVPRFLCALSAGSNTKRFLPASVPAVGQELQQGRSYPVIPTAPGQKTDSFLSGTKKYSSVMLNGTNFSSVKYSREISRFHLAASIRAASKDAWRMTILQ